MLERIDYDYMIVAKHERLNRLLPLERETITDDEILEIRNLYIDIARLNKERKENTVYRPVNYADIMKMSVEGRERVAMSLYISNPLDRKERWEYLVKRQKTMLAYAKLGDRLKNAF